MGKADDRASEVYRRKVRELLLAGHGVAQIAKATGKSYQHAKRIVEQEVAEIEAERTP